MTDNEIMSFEKAMFILRHGSAEGDYKYFEAIDIIEKEVNCQKAEIERLTHNLEAMAQTMPNMAKAERAEAIKEFAKYLIDKSTGGFVYISDIADYAIEMVGDSE